MLFNKRIYFVEHVSVNQEVLVRPFYLIWKKNIPVGFVLTHKRYFLVNSLSKECLLIMEYENGSVYVKGFEVC